MWSEESVRASLARSWCLAGSKRRIAGFRSDPRLRLHLHSAVCTHNAEENNKRGQRYTYVLGEAGGCTGFDSGTRLPVEDAIVAASRCWGLLRAHGIYRSCERRLSYRRTRELSVRLMYITSQRRTLAQWCYAVQ